MRDKRPVDEIPIEELERILAIRKREARQVQLERMKRSGRVVGEPEPVRKAPPPVEQPAASNGDNGKAEPSQPANGVELPAMIVEATAQPSNGATDKPLPPVSAMPRFEDDPDEIDYTGKKQSEQVWRRFVNNSLLLVEVAAVFGLIFIAVNLFGAIDLLERETRSAQQMANATRQASIPTLEPTPTIRRLDEVVLPGGHIFTEDGGVMPNFDEIPSHLLPMVQSELFRPVISRPPQTAETALNVSIPRLNLDESIVQGTDWEALKEGVGQVLNGANPGDDTGNVVLAAHNDIYGELFRYLEDMEPGDRIQIQTERRVYTYVVTHWDIFDPTDVHVMEDQGRPTLTLISCWPYRVSDRRIVVFAERVDT